MSVLSNNIHYMPEIRSRMFDSLPVDFMKIDCAVSDVLDEQVHHITQDMISDELPELIRTIKARANAYYKGFNWKEAVVLESIVIKVAKQSKIDGKDNYNSEAFFREYKCLHGNDDSLTLLYPWQEYVREEDRRKITVAKGFHNTYGVFVKYGGEDYDRHKESFVRKLIDYDTGGF